MRTETVVRLRTGPSTANDRYNKPIPGAVVRVKIPGAMFDPGGSIEPVEVGRAAVVTTPKLYWRSVCPDIVSGDRIEVRGLAYEVQGRPAAWAGRGLVVELKRVDG